MSEPIHITWEQVREAARKAYDEGRLTAQAPDPEDRKCVYHDAVTGRCCAIGAALPKDFSWAGTIGSLISDGVITADDAGRLIGLQRAHDRWCEVFEAHRDDVERLFLEALNA